MTAEETIAILKHLQLKPISLKWGQIFSGFCTALQDARSVTGRDLDSGLVKDESLQGRWIGALAYLILTEQIGRTLKPIGCIPLENCSPFEKALRYFTKLQPDDITALWALRCSFAHDYSIVNEHPRTHERTHHFALLVDSNGPVVLHPQPAWDGSYDSRSRDNATVINVVALGDFIEQMVRDIKEMQANNGLEIALPGGARELRERYSLVYTNDD